MIPFEQASALKNGDVIFSGKYACRVVEVKSDKKARTVAIAYAHGYDTFEGTHAELSMERQAQAPEAAASKPLLPPNNGAEPMARLEAGFARDAQWRSLEWFEQSRAKIAMDLSSKLGIAPEEFSDTPETACFHFMSLALAIGNWLEISGRAELNRASADSMDPMERLARSKAMEGILARLFLHSYVQNIGEMEGLGMLVKAFSQASGVPASMLGHVLTAHTYVRQSSLLMARYCAGGAQGPAPVASGFFQTYEAFFENDPEEFMPRDAAMGASLQISESIQFLVAQASLPVSLRSLPAGDANAHHFLRRYLSMAGMWRAPATLRAGELSLEAATLGSALDSLAEGRPLVLLDAAFQDGDKLEIVIPLNPMTGCPDAQGLASRVAQGGRKLPFPPTVKIAMYPLL